VRRRISEAGVAGADVVEGDLEAAVLEGVHLTLEDFDGRRRVLRDLEADLVGPKPGFEHEVRERGSREGCVLERTG